MATMTMYCVSLMCCLVGILHKCSAFEFDALTTDTDQCSDVCKNSFPAHTYDKASHQVACMRGCRLYNIVSFVETCDNVNHTRASCIAACRDAYGEAEGDVDACSMGCTSHEPVIHVSQQFEFYEPTVFYPLLYVHGVYSNMIDKLARPFVTSWSFYVQSGTQQLLIVRAEPVFIAVDEEVVQQSLTDEHAFGEIESNLAAAVEARGVSGGGGGGGGISISGGSAGGGVNTEWLGCLSNKTGLPRLLLSITILLPAVAMIWLCVTTAATAPTQHVSATCDPAPQKLSIYGDGDLAWLQGDADDDDLLAAVHLSKPTKLDLCMPVKVV